MGIARARTLLTNMRGARRIHYIPPNGRFLQNSQQIEIPGVLETQLQLGADPKALQDFINEQLTGAVHVVYDFTNIQVTGASSGILTPADKELTPLPTAAANHQSTGIHISATPVPGSNVSVYVNGQRLAVGDGVRTKDCYFSADGGNSARAMLNIVAGDTLYFNSLIAGYTLSNVDRVTLDYQVTS